MKNIVTNTKKIISIFILIFIFTIIFFSLKINLYDRHQLKLHPLFTICTIQSFEWGGGASAICTYIVNNKEYTGSTLLPENIDYDPSLVGKRYLFVFEEKNPKNGYIIWKRKFLDSTLQAPPECWKKPPSLYEENEHMNK